MHPLAIEVVQLPATSVDLVLSSGFLAFARHAGVLRAVERARVPIGAVCGTSSGALVGALWAAGHDSEAIVALVAGLAPWRLLRPHLLPWQGLFAMSALQRFLRVHLPSDFASLRTPLAVGVVDAARRFQLLTTGDLPSAVAASCAMPYVFVPIQRAGLALADGGTSDRVGLAAWRDWRPQRQALVHQVLRTAGKDVVHDRTGTWWVQTPRSGASFLSLGDVQGQVNEADALAEPVVATVRASLH